MHMEYIPFPIFILTLKDFELIRTSLAGPVYKEKLRLRAYGAVNEKSTVFLEMKKKYSGVVYKRRVPMELVSAVLYLNNGILPESENQISGNTVHETEVSSGTGGICGL